MYLARKDAVRADGVAGERRRSGGGNEALDVLEDLELGVGEADAAGDLGDQARLGVHVRDHLVHVVEGGLVGLDHETQPGILGDELVVGDDDRDLDELVDREVEPCHLAVDPDESFASVCHPATLLAPPDTPDLPHARDRS